jgi:uncharacterized membrane protein
MSRCSRCGSELTEFAQFCPDCGQPVISPAKTAEPIPRHSGQSLPLGNYLKGGWELFKKYPGGFAGFFLLFIIIHLILHFIPFVGWLVAAVISPALIAGNFIVSAKLIQNQTPEFRDFFAGFNFFLPLLLTGLLTSALVGLGMLLLLAPGIYLMVGYAFASYAVVDRRLDFWQAMELSRRTVNPLWFSVFGLILLLLLINLGGALLLGLGLLVSVPLTTCTLTVAFADLFGLSSSYTGAIPSLRQR